MADIFGFVAEPHKCWLVTPATKDTLTGKITCHDCSGFSGSWSMVKGGKFFPEEGGGCFCEKATNKAQKFCNEKNKGE